MLRGKPGRIFRPRIGYRQLIVTFSLALATWFVIASGNQYEFDEFIPVRSRGLAEQGKILVSDEMPQVKTRIRGRGWSLWQEYFFHRAWYDLQVPTGGGQSVTVELQPEQVVIPAATNLVPVAVLEPRRLDVRFDNIATATLAITPRLELNLMPGYRQVGKPVLFPAQVELTAPASILDTLTTVYTIPLRRDDVSSPLELTALLDIPFNHLQPRTEQVSIRLEVEPLLELSFPNLTVQVINLPQSVRVLADPPVLTVLLAGATSQIRTVTADQLSVTVDFSLWRPEAPRLVPQVNHPEVAELINTTPQLVKLRLIVE
ncbi:hypothetical protein H8D51_02420 [bacterium]|nr:hypothetical protein [bacterium]